MTQRISPEVVTAWEQAFCELTEYERDLLTDYLAVGLRGQEQYILKRYMEPMECPACQVRVPARQALGHPIDHGSVEDDAFTCPSCNRALDYTVPFIGVTYWRLKVPLGPAVDTGAQPAT